MPCGYLIYKGCSVKVSILNINYNQNECHRNWVPMADSGPAGGCQPEPAGRPVLGMWPRCRLLMPSVGWQHSVWETWSMLVLAFQQNPKENLKTPKRLDFLVPICSERWKLQGDPNGTSLVETWELDMPLSIQTIPFPIRPTSTYNKMELAHVPEWKWACQVRTLKIFLRSRTN